METDDYELSERTGQAINKIKERRACSDTVVALLLCTVQQLCAGISE